MSDDFLTMIGIKLPDLFAGFAGGVVNAFVFKRSNPWEIVGSMVVGALTANFLTEPAAHMLGLSSGPAGFIVGMAGMAICQGAVTAAKSWKPTFPGSGGVEGGRQ